MSITVITGDSSYEFKARDWLIRPDGQLDISAGTPDGVIASFPKGLWIGVYQTSAATMPP